MLCLVFILGIDALYCYTCIAIDCPGDHIECEAVRDFTVLQLRSLYYLDDYKLLPACPQLNQTLEWRLMEPENPPCPHDLTNAASCSAGRIMIKTNRGIDKPILISYATILGCANRVLVQNLKAAILKSSCDVTKTNGSTAELQLTHQLEIEHCSQLETYCFEKDFCVRHEQSVIKPFRNSNNSLARFDVGLVLGIVAFIIVIFAAVIGASLCSFPLNRPSNLPKSSTVDTDLVAVRTNTSEDYIRKKELIDELQSLNK